MEKRCVNYVGICCVNGSCPQAQEEYYGPKTDCWNCFKYKGCQDCALAGTEECKEVLYNGSEE